MNAWIIIHTSAEYLTNLVYPKSTWHEYLPELPLVYVTLADESCTVAWGPQKINVYHFWFPNKDKQDWDFKL